MKLYRPTEIIAVCEHTQLTPCAVDGYSKINWFNPFHDTNDINVCEVAPPCSD
jgi:hypothetical protein